MKHIAKTLVLMGTLVSAGAASANLVEGLNPLLGLDVKWSEHKGKDTYKNILPKKSVWGGSIYLGSRFHENAGFEVGYDWTSRQKRSVTATELSGLVGSTSDAAFLNVRHHAGHLDMNGYLPLCNGIELIGALGVGFVKPKVGLEVQAAGSSHLSAGIKDALESVKGRNRPVARVGLGAQYMVSEMVGLKGMVRWEQLSNVRIKGDGLVAQLPKKVYKDAVSCSLGAFVRF